MITRNVAFSFSRNRHDELGDTAWLDGLTGDNDCGVFAVTVPSRQYRSMDRYHISRWSDSTLIHQNSPNSDESI